MEWPPCASSDSGRVPCTLSSPATGAGAATLAAEAAEEGVRERRDEERRAGRMTSSIHRWSRLIFPVFNASLSFCALFLSLVATRPMRREARREAKHCTHVYLGSKKKTKKLSAAPIRRALLERLVPRRCRRRRELRPDQLLNLLFFFRVRVLRRGALLQGANGALLGLRRHHEAIHLFGEGGGSRVLPLLLQRRRFFRSSFPRRRRLRRRHCRRRLPRLLRLRRRGPRRRLRVLGRLAVPGGGRRGVPARQGREGPGVEAAPRVRAPALSLLCFSGRCSRSSSSFTVLSCSSSSSSSRRAVAPDGGASDAPRDPIRGGDRRRVGAGRTTTDHRRRGRRARGPRRGGGALCRQAAFLLLRLFSGFLSRARRPDRAAGHGVVCGHDKERCFGAFCCRCGYSLDDGDDDDDALGSLPLLRESGSGSSEPLFFRSCRRRWRWRSPELHRQRRRFRLDPGRRRSSSGGGVARSSGGGGDAADASRRPCADSSSRCRSAAAGPLPDGSSDRAGRGAGRGHGGQGAKVRIFLSSPPLLSLHFFHSPLS